MQRSATTRTRAVRIAPIELTVRHGAGGIVYMQSSQALGPYPAKITERLESWAARTPDRPFLAQRDVDGGWRQVTYAEARARVRRIAR